MSDLIKVGDKFQREYPFKHYCNDTLVFGEHQQDEGWAKGCHLTEEFDGNYYTARFFHADALGEIEYEVLAVVEMPRKMQTRIIYKMATTDPDGIVKKSSVCHIVTISKFERILINPFPAEFEVE